MNKKFISLFLLLFITNCAAPGTAFLGPAFTVVETGNLYQACMSYGSSQIIKKTKEKYEKIKEAKTVVYKRIDEMQIKIENNKLNKIVLKNQADLFFKSVKNNLKKYN